MAHNAVSSETATEVITDSRESPLLLRGFRGIDRQATRRERSLRDENVRYRFLKWIALSISAIFVVNIILAASQSLSINTTSLFCVMVTLYKVKLIRNGVLVRSRPKHLLNLGSTLRWLTNPLTKPAANLLQSLENSINTRDKVDHLAVRVELVRQNLANLYRQ